MLGFLTIFICVCEVAFPVFMLCLVYPFSKKAALFWSDWISTRCARVVPAIFSFYRKFTLECDKRSLSLLPEQYFVVSNHQSFFDIVVYFNFLGGKTTKFVAKDALAKAPMIGKMLKSQGHCIIPRHGNTSKAMYVLEKFGKAAEENKFNPVIFPEGTRSRDGLLGKFYASGFCRIEEITKLPVAVCALDGGLAISKFDLSLKNIYKCVYKVKVLKVFPPPQSREEEKKVLENARSLIEAQLSEWRFCSKKRFN